jgi:hypothetical protein
MLDALASGIPVAAFPVIGPLDVITSDKVGKLDINLKDAVIAALQLNGEDCRNYALKYSWTNCTEQFFNNLVPVCEEIEQTECNLVAENFVK